MRAGIAPGMCSCSDTKRTRLQVVAMTSAAVAETGRVIVALPPLTSA